MIRGFRPTTLIRRVQPRSKWDELDFELFEALDTIDREVSDVHGLPRWLTSTASPEVGIEVDTMEDVAAAALDEWDENHQGKKRKRGVTRYAVPRSLTGEPIEGGLARERMLRADAEAREGADPDLDGLDIERVRPKEGYRETDYG